MSSIIGQCADCCTCWGVGRVESKSRSVSKSKFGYFEFINPSSPPKRYLTKTVTVSNFASSDTYSSGQAQDSSCCVVREDTSRTVGGGTRASYLDPITGALTEDPVPDNYMQYSSHSAVYSGNVCVNPIYCPPSTSSNSSSPVAWNTISASGSPIQTVTPTTITREYSFNDSESHAVPPAFCPTVPGGAYVCSGNYDYTHASNSTYSESLSNEHTTEMLVTNTVNALPPYGATWFSYAASPITNVPTSASRNLSSNEASCAVSESLYRFRFKVPKVGGGNFTITWVERFTPEGGGTPVDTVKSFVWDKTVPEGYNPDVFSTWPMSPEYTLAIPSTDGTVRLACVKTTCDGTAPTNPCTP